MLGYISDDERPRSPGLEEVKVKYTPPQSPVSFLPQRRQMTENGPGGQQSRKRGRISREGKFKPSQGDVVLLNYLDPNRPDIATTAGQRALFPSESASEKGDDGESRKDEDEDKPAEAKTLQQPNPSRFHRDNEQLPPLHRALDPGGHGAGTTDVEMPDAAPNGELPRGTVTHHERMRLDDDQDAQSAKKNDTNQALARLPQIQEQIDTWGRAGFDRKPKLSAKGNTSASLPSVTRALTSSAPILNHILAAPSGSPRAQELRIAESVDTASGQKMSLPPVDHLMEVAEAQDEEAMAQQRPRTTSISSVSSTFAPNASTTPGSATSAHFFASKAGQQPIIFPVGRVQTDPTPLPPPVPQNIRPLGHSLTNPIDYAMTSGAGTYTTYTTSVASSSTAGATPNSTNDAPTPSDRSSITVQVPLSPDTSTHSSISVADASAANGPQSLYRCNHPGCRAAPFQTPYLLNSHRNVHSNDRPYYCSRKDCPRSQPGKGFKRKNEMLRHGLVHNSPGYVCPFCSPEKEHRYPRPDNLQRHVRMHHEDIDLEDIRLREVLGQRRTAGSGSSAKVAAGKRNMNNARDNSNSAENDAEDDEAEMEAAPVTRGSPGKTAKGKARAGSMVLEEPAVANNVGSSTLAQRGKRRKGTGQ